ncbi:beta-glucosidase [Bifidobacterium tissieri]|uniref:beta-glucosidase n=2 Tax=Bifidobacterium tissieri TaxID=1630162 RepID=A0A5M9ZTF3_9BIFI|nr:glycoside hydrolase family 3 N-terminal domain-containing protein [Bifidobacterium tissieri]KAA8830132.1 beta-glucosidase [Bifidobacterium tissieri]KAA8830923.1 beta-glucosidase [Bifidobacterium tissieri]
MTANETTHADTANVVPEDTSAMPFRDPSLSVDERIADLLGRMTLKEKIGQMMQLDARGDLDDEILRVNVGSILHTSPENLYRAADLVKQTRLQIPLIIGEDLIHGYSFYPGATIFPEQLGMAVSWNPELVEKAARVTAEEGASTGVHWTFSPVLCIARDTRWGRVGETFGEDPHLIGEMASAMVRGYQKGPATSGSLDKDAILATAKHFAGYSETQGGRDASEADLSHRKLASWFLPPFERVAKEGCGTFMLGYESIEGTPVTFNKWLLSDVLRGEWGYKGTLITDWDNVGRSVWEQKVQPDFAHAAAAAVKAGNDLVMTTPQFYEGAYEAIQNGMLTEEELDSAVARILALKFRLGLFEDPRLPDTERIKTVIGSDAHGEANLELARQSVALLRNDGALPFDVTADGTGKTIAVVGPLADDAQNQLGDWAGSSGQVTWMPDGHPRETITTVKDAFESLVPDGWTVTYSRGANVVDLVTDPAGELYPDGQPRPKIGVSAAVDQQLLDEAVANARKADLIVAVVGDVVQLIGETCSTATLDLLGGQNALLDALADVSRETGKPLVVVLMSSKPQILPASIVGENGVFAKRVNDPEAGAGSILWAPSPGMKGGQAIAEIILGITDPSGRLPITFPRHAGQLPVYYNQIRGQHGDRYADLTQDPAFAFGEGLSYTTFAYGDVVIENGDTPFGTDDMIHAHVDVTNTGDRAGVEVVQAYVSDVVTSVSWTDRELKAFRRVELEPGETKTLEFDIPVADCTIVGSDARRFVESGEFELLIGHSSRREDLNSATFEVR